MNKKLRNVSIVCGFVLGVILIHYLSNVLVIDPFTGILISLVAQFTTYGFFAIINDNYFRNNIDGKN